MNRGPHPGTVENLRVLDPMDHVTDLDLGQL